jgi:hypothetical protein
MGRETAKINEYAKPTFGRICQLGGRVEVDASSMATVYPSPTNVENQSPIAFNACFVGVR